MAYTTEQLLERWENVHEIENLMGRRSFFLLWIQDQKVFEEMWTKNEPTLGFNSGYYVGYESVAAYFKALRDLYIHRAEFAKATHRDELGDKAAEDLIGVGALHPNNLTTPLIELAEDMQTAKGMWYYMDASVDYGVTGRESNMRWGRLAVDFIKEDDGWKIWHMIYADDLDCEMGGNWTKPAPEKEKDPIFGMLEGIVFPEPDKPGQHEVWNDKRQLREFPRMPVPYKTFAETFSYGV